MLDCKASEDEIRGHAIFSAGRARTLVKAWGKRAGAMHSGEEFKGALDAIAVACQARPCPSKMRAVPTMMRMTDASWWQRNLRQSLRQENEVMEHEACAIRRRGQVYASDYAVKVTLEKAKANRAALEAMEVVNESGAALNLAGVSDASVSNPKLRRAELMVRARGFEETAQYMKHEAHFLTITCPSRFHRFNAQSKPNPKWDGSTPREAQDYLCKLWAKIRAAWKRKGYMPYGFRVSEPHHDGCPHWHLLLFIPPEQAGWFEARRFVADRSDAGAGMLGIAGRYALAESAGEPGAMKHRFTAKAIDLSKGSATGYIAKYISKNIDGLKEGGADMGLDFASGKNASDSSTRVRVWASTWGIRQFQQIGGPSVTVWRELRALGTDLEQPLQLPLFEMPRAAADRSLWSLFWVLQGGPEVPRRALTLTPCYVEDGITQYGEVAKRIRGVTGLDDDGEIYYEQTRFQDWVIQKSGLAAVNQDYEKRVARMAMDKRVDVLRRLGFGGLDAREAGAWTGVNNCTDKGEQDVQEQNEDDGQTRADFDSGSDDAGYLASLRAVEKRPDAHKSNGGGLRGAAD